MFEFVNTNEKFVVYNVLVIWGRLLSTTGNHNQAHCGSAACEAESGTLRNYEHEDKRSGE